MATMLIVDDRPTNRQFLLTLLGYGGHRLLEASDGAEALQLVHAERPDLVITDILMPTMDGFEFVQNLRADPTLAPTPVIFYTATYRASEARVLAKACGVEHVLAKPAEPQLILNTVQAALGASGEAVSPSQAPVEIANDMLGVTRLRQLSDDLTRYFTDLHTATHQLSVTLEHGEAMMAERDFLLSIAAKFSSVITNLQGLNLKLSHLNELGLDLLLERDPARMLELFCEAARKIMQAKYAAMGILAGDERTLIGFYSSGLEAETIAKIGALPVGKGLLGRAITERRPVRVRAIAADPAHVGFPPGHPSMHSFLAVPLHTATQLYGHFYLTDKIDAEEFNEEDERIATALAAQISVAYENLVLYDQIQRHAANLQLQVTERQKAEAALRESEERFRAWVENTLDLVTVVDLKGTILYESPSIRHLLGYTPDELVGTRAFDITHPEDRDWLLEIFAQHIQQPERIASAEFRLRHRDDSWRLFEGVGKAYMDEHGQVAGLINSRDITERNQAEAELAALYRATSPLLNPGNNLANLAEEIVETVTREFALANCSVLLVDEVGGELKRVAWAGDYPVATASTLPVNGPGLTVTAFRSGEMVYAPDVTADPRYLVSDSRTRSELVVPLRNGPHVIGLLDLQSMELNGFDERARRLIATYAERAALALQNARLYTQTEERLHRLSALRSIDLAISGSLDLRVTLNVVLEEVISNLNVDAADVLLLSPYTHRLNYTVGRGFRSRAVEKGRISSREGYASRAMLERRTIRLPNLADEEPDLSRAALMNEEGFQGYFGVPLIAKANVTGVLEIFHRTPLLPNSEWLDFLEALAGQAAIAVDNAELFNQLQNSNAQLIIAYDATIEGWSRALDLRDKETEGHSQRVTEMTLRLAQAMGIGEDELVHVRRGALLHDIGKMGVPDQILLKPGKLTEDEWDIMRKHPTYAHELLSPIVYLRPALDIPYCHHEKWDGTGYPRGLKDEQIPLAARLFAVVDVWDALRSDRPYRLGWPEEKVLEHIRSQSGTHFDPAVVELFLRVAGSQSMHTGAAS